MIKIFFDGGTALNSICFVNFNMQSYVISKIEKPMTNNELEYTALIKAIEYAKSVYKGLNDITFYGDSEVVIKQLTGVYKVRSTNLKPLFQTVCKLVNMKFTPYSQIGECDFEWVPRKENLAGIALEEELERRRGL